MPWIRCVKNGDRRRRGRRQRGRRHSGPATHWHLSRHSRLSLSLFLFLSSRSVSQEAEAGGSEDPLCCRPHDDARASYSNCRQIDGFFMHSMRVPASPVLLSSGRKGRRERASVAVQPEAEDEVQEEEGEEVWHTRVRREERFVKQESKRGRER